MIRASYNKGVELDRAFIRLKQLLDLDGVMRLLEDFDLVHALAAGKIDVQTIRNGLTFSFPIDYTMTVAQLLRAGRYDSVYGDVNDTNFPITGSGTIIQSGVLVYLGRGATDETIMTEFQDRKLRDATNQELLTFGIKFPGALHEKSSVIQRGSVYMDPSGRKYDSCLSARGDSAYEFIETPRVFLHHIDHDWICGDCILAFPQVLET